MENKPIPQYRIDARESGDPLWFLLEPPEVRAEIAALRAEEATASVARMAIK